ncbi:MAG TPA: NAD(P)-binding domain-containing protein [Kofleriaceae bacterium]|nr:NAD(P)-binding domain-containing protein [Kofleriaceae bacterium]
MKIAVLGTGMVGATMASKLVAVGHEVMMGSRARGNEKATAWVAGAGERASEGAFADAAAFGGLAFNCTKGEHALAVIEAAGAANLAGKVLIDVSNPLDFSRGFPPRLSVCNDDSLGEQIQRAVPDARVVKAFNTIAAPVMVDPSLVPGDHDLLVCGNDAEAKAEVTKIAREWFGWTHVVDVGGLDGARATEAYLLMWTRLYGAFGTGTFNLHFAR